MKYELGFESNEKQIYDKRELKSKANSDQYSNRIRNKIPR